jgi:hypothetical protein
MITLDGYQDQTLAMAVVPGGEVSISPLLSKKSTAMDNLGPVGKIIESHPEVSKTVDRVAGKVGRLVANPGLMETTPTPTPRRGIVFSGGGED